MLDLQSASRLKERNLIFARAVLKDFRMEDKIKIILSRYIKIPEDQIFSDTIIDRTTISSSILIHRMYANLAEEGIHVSDYWNIRTYGDLCNKLAIGDCDTNRNNNLINTAHVHDFKLENVNSYVGIDIVELSEMPQTTNFREHEFYKMNFTHKEISYCILKADPIASFAGIFAAKEAIIKVDSTLKSIPFNKLEIDHLPSGKPIHSKYELSITHSGNTAVAVAFNLSLILQNQNTSLNYPPHTIWPKSMLYIFCFIILLAFLFYFLFYNSLF